MALNEHEAIEMALAVSTAMLNNDKTLREMLYEDLDVNDLKRVLRWTARMSIGRHLVLCEMTGSDPAIAWQEYSLGMLNAHEAKGGSNE
jgi:hypothetical protein